MTKEENINEQIKQATAPLKADLDKMTLILVGVVIVLFIGFASMYVAFAALNSDSNGQKTAAFQQLSSQIQTQGEKIQELSSQLKSSNLNNK